MQVLAALQRLDTKLEDICAEVECYPQLLVNVRLDEQQDLVNRPAVQEAVLVAERELAGRGRVLLRPSGTEPLVRVMVEGADSDQVEELAHRLAGVVRDRS